PPAAFEPPEELVALPPPAPPPVPLVRPCDWQVFLVGTNPSAFGTASRRSHVSGGVQSASDAQVFAVVPVGQSRVLSRICPIGQSSSLLQLDTPSQVILVGVSSSMMDSRNRHFVLAGQSVSLVHITAASQLAPKRL